MFFSSKEFWALLEKSTKTLSVMVFLYYVSINIQGDIVGEYILIEVFLFIFLIVCLGGMEVTSNKYFIDIGEPDTLTHVVILRSVVSVLLVFSCFYWISTYNLNFPIYFLFFALLIPFNIGEQYCYHKGRYVEYYKGRVLLILISILVKVVAVDSSYFMELMVLSFIIEYASSWLFFPFCFFKNSVSSVFNLGLKKNINSALSITRNSIPALFSSLAIIGYSRIDQLMISQVLGYTDVAAYAVIVKISDAFIFLPTLLCTLYLPKAYRSGLKYDFTINFCRVVVLASAVSYFLALGLYFIYQATGSDLSIDYNTALLYFISVPLNFIGVVISQFQVYRGNSLNRLFRILFGLGLNLVINYMLIPVYGVLGAVISTLVSLFVSNLLLVIITRDRALVECFCKSIITIRMLSLKSLN